MRSAPIGPVRHGAVPALRDGDCQVWWARAVAGPREDLLALLDEPERARWQRLLKARDRALYVTAHALARLVVGAHLALSPDRVRFEARCRTCGSREHGKPHPVGAEELGVSWSHSGTAVVLAVARGAAVGVDVEERTARVEDLVEVALDPAERSALAALPSSRRTEGFLRYWTRKEALLKATGDGLAVPPDAVRVSAPDEPARLLAWNAAAPLDADVDLVDLDAPAGHLACLALLRPPAAASRGPAGPDAAAFSQGPARSPDDEPVMPSGHDADPLLAP